MKFQVLFFCVVMSFFSCSNKMSKPDNLISEDKMVDIIYETSILSAAKGAKKSILEDNGILPEQYLYSKYDIDSLQFVTSLNYYVNSIDIYKELYDRVEERIVKEKFDIEQVIESNIEGKKEINKKKETKLIGGLKDKQGDTLKPKGKIKELYKVGIKVRETDIVFKDNVVYEAVRSSVNKPAYIALGNQKITSGDTVEVSIYVKKTKTKSALGLRISGVFPNRVDAVFDLNKGVLKGTKSKGYFEKESASIRLINQDWYECKINVKANIDQVKIVFGPTDIDTDVGAWEGKSEILTKLRSTLPVINLK